MVKGNRTVLAEVARQLAELTSTPVTDRELLHKFAATRDEAAFAALVARHAAMVLGVCRRRLSNLADAEDATQAVFLLLARKAARPNWQPSVANWLYEVARKVCRNARVSASRRVAREARAPVREAASPLESMSALELLRVLDEELGRLPCRYREPLILCHLEGLTRDEAAQRLGVLPNTLKIQLDRGRKKLADALTRRGCALGTLLLAAGASGSLAASNLPESILAAVTGTPSEAVRAIAEGVTMGGSFTATKVALAGAFFASVVGFAFTMSEPEGPTPPDSPAQKVEAPARAEARPDSFEDPLPEGAAMRLGTTQFRAANLIGVGFRKTGELVALGRDLTLTAWPADGSPRSKVTRVTDEKPNLRNSLGALAISPDARYVLGSSARGAKLVIWDITGEKAVEYLSREGYYHSWGSQFSPTAEWLVAHNLNQDWETNRKARHEFSLCHLPTKEWTALAGIDLTGTYGLSYSFTSDGKRLLVVSDRHAWLVDTVKKAVVRRLPGWHEDRADKYPFLPWSSMGAGEISPDGKTVVTVPRDRLHQPAPVVRLLSSETGKEIAKFQRPVSWARFSPDGKSLWAGGRSNLFEVDASSGKVRREIAVPTSRPVEFSPDGKTLVLPTRSAVTLVDGREGKVLRPELLNGGALAPIVGIAVSPDGKVIATDDENHDIRLWDASTGKPLGRVESVRWGPPLFEFLPHSRSFLAVGRDHLAIAEYESSGGKELRRFPVPEYYAEQAMVQQMRLSPDGKVLTTDVLGKTADLTRWDVASGKVIGRESKERPNSFFFGLVTLRSRDGKWTVDQGKLSSLDGEGSVRVADFLFSQVEFTADSRFVLWPTNEGDRPTMPDRIAIYDLTKRTRHGELLTGLPRRFAVSADGRWVGAYTANEFAVWEFASLKKVWSAPIRPAERPEELGPGAVQKERMALTPDGRRLISAEDGNAIVWDASGTGRTSGEAAPPLTPDTLTRYFESLAGEDAAAAHRAAWELSDRPAEALALLRDRLKPATTETGQLIDRLDSPTFAEREAAGKALLELDPSELAEFRSRLGDKLSAEQKTRIDAALKRHAPPNSLSPAVLRHTRAVAVLERIGNAEARKRLEELSRGAPEAVLTREATRSLERLERGRDR